MNNVEITRDMFDKIKHESVDEIEMEHQTCRKCVDNAVEEFKKLNCKILDVAASDGKMSDMRKLLEPLDLCGRCRMVTWFRKCNKCLYGIMKKVFLEGKWNE
nr:MAG: hypothetical protein [Helarchaeota virus Nidhogg Meg22_1012]URC17313.1 MAG: hypothetical protein [Helarchaeota virus Nidhogg Meg22_1214]